MLKHAAALFLLVSCLPLANAAQLSTHQLFGAREVLAYDISTSPGIITGGTTIIQAMYPDNVNHRNDFFELTVKVTLPSLTVTTALVTGAYDIQATGCPDKNFPRAIIATPNTGGANIEALASENSITYTGFSNGLTGGEASFSFNAKMQVTGTTCSGNMAYVLCATTTVPLPGVLPACTVILAQGQMAFNVHTNDQYVDNLNRLCANSAFNTTCTAPDFGDVTVNSNLTLPDFINVTAPNFVNVTLPSFLNFTGANNITATFNAEVFDWEAFALKYFAAALAAVMVWVFFTRRDPIFGLIAIALLVFVMFAYPWHATILAVYVALILYMIVSMLLLKKAGGLRVA